MSFDICLLQRCVYLVSLDLSIAVGLLRQTRSRYLRCRLEAKMAGFILGLGGFIEIVSVTSGGMKIDERVEDTVILLSQFNSICFRISNQIRKLDISLEGFIVDCL